MSYQTDILTGQAIKKIIAAHYQVDLSNRKRTREFWFPRFLAMAIIKHKTRLSLKDIGGLFGRDHSTTVSSLKMMDNLVDTEVETVQEVKHVYEMVAKQLK